MSAEFIFCVYTGYFEPNFSLCDLNPVVLLCGFYCISNKFSWVIEHLSSAGDLDTGDVDVDNHNPFLKLPGRARIWQILRWHDIADKPATSTSGWEGTESIFHIWDWRRRWGGLVLGVCEKEGFHQCTSFTQRGGVGLLPGGNTYWQGDPSSFLSHMVCHFSWEQYPGLLNGRQDHLNCGARIPFSLPYESEMTSEKNGPRKRSKPEVRQKLRNT